MSDSYSPAGPSRTPMNVSPPLQQGDPATSEQARTYLLLKRRFTRILPTFCRRRRKAKIQVYNYEPDTTHRDCHLLPSLPVSDAGLVEINDEQLRELPCDDATRKPVYKWATLYENQRGITLFSTPYYSPQSLLPLDPPSYTLPTPEPSRRVWNAQPTVSLASYPLPDGTWHWVSRDWMIDMRGDEVQHDGFEYAWSFRSRRWRPNAGWLGAGGWVRRRRWVRLMVRNPRRKISATNLKQTGDGNQLEGTPIMAEHAPQLVLIMHEDDDVTRPPSVVSSPVEDEDDVMGVWKGDERDWTRCHDALKRLDRDGRKLELWKRWLGIDYPLDESDTAPNAGTPEENKEEIIVDGKGKGKIISRQYDAPPSSPGSSSVDKELANDTGIRLEKAPKEFIAPIIRIYGAEVLNLFVYPDSRAQFLQILDIACLLEELRAGMSVPNSSEVVDFWSYGHELESLRDRRDLDPDFEN
ncbi:uncharacterized protein FIBRA_09422 [Fibroporia radiculosa]|uniref:TECPR1-like DysF domain-containing protein n=1 Tax=Fibroporia radiculosa TaxID=599839 RepID=J7RW00_9APHY|nr:uncharacterized protein FIBRA_09422 [Fibroporia radiculosa]CCM07095.1 predicted protein [Fibroporia radiculosa]